MNLLAEGGARINARDHAGETPLHGAAYKGRDAVVLVVDFEGEAWNDVIALAEVDVNDVIGCHGRNDAFWQTNDWILDRHPIALELGACLAQVAVRLGQLLG